MGEDGWVSHEHQHEHEHAQPGPSADASVRRARVTDAPAVGLVQSEVWRDAYAGVLPEEVVATFEPGPFTAAWRTSLENPPQGVHTLLVACAGEQVVGLAAIGPSQDPDGGTGTGELLVLGVHPAARRQGHGSRLLNACVDILREAGGDELSAWVLSVHEETRAFLHAAGLSPDGAFRDREVSPDGSTVREVRLTAHLGDDEAI